MLDYTLSITSSESTPETPESMEDTGIEPVSSATFIGIEFSNLRLFDTERLSLFLAGVTCTGTIGIEPISSVLETDVLNH